MLFRKIVLTTLAAAALTPAANAQTRRTTRPGAPRPAGQRTTPQPARRTPASPAPARAAAAAPTGINLSAADMGLVIEGLGFPPEVRAQLASSAEERRAFAKDIRQMLATAEEAKAAGYLTRPELKLQSDLSRAFVIAQAYFKQRQGAGASSPEQVVTPAEIEALFAQPATPPQFEAFIQDYAKNSPERGAPVSEEKRKELRGHYGRVMVGMRKGVEAGLDRDRKTQLVVMLQQARLLAGAYSKELTPRFKATDAEVEAYLAGHPELDTKTSRAKIEGLLARARAGEDFGKLAGEFSEDPGSRTQGGDLGWFGRGMMVKPFEETAFALKPGEVSGVIESQFGFHIIKLEERRPPAAGAEAQGEQVRARHILIRFNNAPRRPNSPPMSPREQARAAVEAEKRDRALDEMVARRRVQVAEEYDVNSTVDVPAGGGSATTPRTPATRPAGQTPAAQAPARTPAARPTPARPAPARRRP